MVGAMLIYHPPLILDMMRRGTMLSSTSAQDKVPISIKGMPANEQRTPPIRLTQTLPTHLCSMSMLVINGATSDRKNIDKLVL